MNCSLCQNAQEWIARFSSDPEFQACMRRVMNAIDSGIDPAQSDQIDAFIGQIDTQVRTNQIDLLESQAQAACIQLILNRLAAFPVTGDVLALKGQMLDAQTALNQKIVDLQTSVSTSLVTAKNQLLDLKAQLNCQKENAQFFKKILG